MLIYFGKGMSVAGTSDPRQVHVEKYICLVVMIFAAKHLVYTLFWNYQLYLSTVLDDMTRYNPHYTYCCNEGNNKKIYITLIVQTEK